VKAMELGADEYIIKPVGQMEIVARVKALIRRLESTASHPHEFVLGAWHYDAQRSQMHNDTFQVSLTSTENAILQVLANHLTCPH